MTTLTFAGTGAPAGRLRALLEPLVSAGLLELTRMTEASTTRLAVAAVASARNDFSDWLQRAPGLNWVLVGADCAADAIWALRHGASGYCPWSVLEDEREALEARLAALLEAAGQLPDSGAACIEAPTSREAYRLARRVAPRDVAVFVQGPSGSGKEVLARFLHAHSPRRSGPFVAVNCAAIPENMLEATLFGHERGAFTGADRARRGKFLEAAGGTLLLDEITEMPIELQPKLLRALQEQEVEPVGAGAPVPTNIRVIATSNRELKSAVADGRLREDLYYRLNVFPVHLPPLADRREDVVPLAQRFAAREGVCLRDDAISLLLAHDWPGNVRELENCIARAAIVCQADQIGPADLGLVRLDTREGFKQQLLEREDQLIVRALRSNDGHRGATARALGISERTLRYRLARLREAGTTL
ncbi:MAG: sigma 54-interacting transcriptional regulator [Pseudomonadota bacterium]